MRVEWTGWGFIFEMASGVGKKEAQGKRGVE